MSSTLTGPRVPQVTPSVEDVEQFMQTEGFARAPISVTAELDDAGMTLRLDPNTAAVLLGLLRDRTPEVDAEVRRTAREAEQRPSAGSYLNYLAGKAHRLRTVIDAYDTEWTRVNGPAVTYDVD